jgi:hypothetical protein
MDRATITGEASTAVASTNETPEAKEENSFVRKIRYRLELFYMSKFFMILVPIGFVVLFIIAVVVLNLAFIPMGIFKIEKKNRIRENIVYLFKLKKLF